MDVLKYDMQQIASNCYLHFAKLEKHAKKDICLTHIVISINIQDKEDLLSMNSYKTKLPFLRSFSV